MSEDHDVVLLRSADEPDPYVSAFGEVGLQAVCEPVLTFAFPNQSQLRAVLAQHAQYGGLIATSPRVGAALERLFAERANLARAWQGATAYVVGPKTAKRLRELGLAPKGAGAGDAKTLAHQIISDFPAAPLLFLSGNRRRETLPEALRAAGVPFEETVVYETRLRDDLTLPGSQGTTWLAFFSPSGLKAVQRAEEVDLSEYRIAAIGPTTGEALEEAGYFVEAIAAEPSPEGLVAAITAGEREE